MDRYIIDLIDEWYSSARRKPLVVRGARQVGKSTAVRKFASARQLKLYEINLERNPSLEHIFATLDSKKILPELEAVLSERIQSEGGVLFLDEIQATPSALAALRYFYEEMPELCVVSAGSLLEFVLESHKFSMPVGRIQYLHLEPMTFSEYLLGIGDEYLHQRAGAWLLPAWGLVLPGGLVPLGGWCMATLLPPWGLVLLPPWGLVHGNSSTCSS